jgi:hypothetical protein
VSQIVAVSAAPARPCPVSSAAPTLSVGPDCEHCSGKSCIRPGAEFIELWWAPNSLLDLADVRGAHEIIREVSDGYLLPLVVYLQGLVGIAPDARSVILEGFFSSRVAFVGTGPVDQVIAAFLEQALTETRYFECPQAAAAWAREALDDA